MHKENKELNKKKQGSPIWVIIIILLFIITVMFVSWSAYIWSPLGGGDFFSFFIVMFFSLPLAIIDFIAAFFFIRTQHPHGKTKIISYIVYIASSFMFSYFVWFNIGYWNLIDIDRYSDFYLFLFNNVIGVIIAIVATILSVIFLRLKSHT
jgi:hypothetical protein